MIKKDTIVSTTEGRLTLLQWLKKVEAALKNASATAVKGVPQEDGKVVFEIDFADGTNIKSDPFELPEKLPDGYAVDASGNVTLNGGLLIDKLGNVEIGKNAAVDGTLTLNTRNDLVLKTGTLDPYGYVVGTDGNVTLNGSLLVKKDKVEAVKDLTVNGDFVRGLVGVYTLPIKKYNGNSALIATLDCFVFNGDYESISGHKSRFFALYMLSSPSGGEKWYLGVLETNTRPQSSSTPINNPADIKNACVYHNEDNAIIRLTDVKYSNAFDAFSKAKYQHTVHITALSDTDKQLNVSFTATSSKSTPVNSYQNLHNVFGGRNLTVSGLIKYWGMGVPIHLDLHGGTIETDKVYFVDASSAGAYQQPTLSQFPNIAFTDDVVPA